MKMREDQATMTLVIETELSCYVEVFCSFFGGGGGEGEGRRGEGRGGEGEGGSTLPLLFCFTCSLRRWPVALRNCTRRTRF